MFRKSSALIVLVSLSFVFLITFTFLLTSTNGSIISHEAQKKFISEVPKADGVQHNDTINYGEKNTEAHDPPEDNSEIDDETNKKGEAQDVGEQSLGVENNNNNENIEQVQDTKNPQPNTVLSKEQPVVKIDNHLNKQTTNTNILCLGIADDRLEMISLYSINKNNRKSAGIFLPTRTTIRVNGELLSLQEVYSQYGILNLKKIISQCLEVDIPYHMVADKQGLVELSELIGPMYVENESIDIPNLFVKPVTEKDDLILQSLAKKITQPKMVLQLPRLIKIFINNVESDIGVSGLWDLYKVFKNLNHSELAKVVLWGEKVKMAEKTYWFIEPYDWHNIVYEMTK